MPNGKIGDHPLTDILIHNRRVYSERADALIRSIVALGGRDEIAAMLVLDCSPFTGPNVARLEEVLLEIHDRLRRETC